MSMENENEIELYDEQDLVQSLLSRVEQDEDAKDKLFIRYNSQKRQSMELTPSLMINVPRIDFVRLAARLTSAVSSTQKIKHSKPCKRSESPFNCCTSPGSISTGTPCGVSITIVSPFAGLKHGISTRFYRIKS